MHYSLYQLPSVNDHINISIQHLVFCTITVVVSHDLAPLLHRHDSLMLLLYAHCSVLIVLFFDILMFGKKMDEFQV